MKPFSDILCQEKRYLFFIIEEAVVLGKKSFFYLVLLLLLISNLNTYAGIKVKDRSPYRSNFSEVGYYKLKFNYGVSLWHFSLQNNLHTDNKPFILGVELSRFERPYSIALETNFLSSYVVEQFSVRPYHLSISPKYYLSGLMELPSGFNAFAQIGIDAWYAQFKEEKYNGVSSYKGKREDDFGIGPVAGIGVTLKLHDPEICPKILYTYGVGKFYAGHFTKQDLNIGATQLYISFNYKLDIGKKCWICGD